MVEEQKRTKNKGKKWEVRKDRVNERKKSRSTMLKVSTYRIKEMNPDL